MKEERCVWLFRHPPSVARARDDDRLPLSVCRPSPPPPLCVRVCRVSPTWRRRRFRLALSPKATRAKGWEMGNLALRSRSLASILSTTRLAFAAWLFVPRRFMPCLPLPPAASVPRAQSHRHAAILVAASLPASSPSPLLPPQHRLKQILRQTLNEHHWRDDVKRLATGASVSFAHVCARATGRGKTQTRAAVSPNTLSFPSPHRENPESPGPDVCRGPRGCHHPRRPR